MKQILLLHFACEVSEQLIEQILAEFVGPLLQFDVGGGQRLACIVGRILVCGEIFGFNILLRLIDGTVFDSSYKRGQAVDLRANQVIKGWTEALVHMPAGSVWEVYILQELAYGEREQGQIKPYSPLVFKIELIKVSGK